MTGLRIAPDLELPLDMVTEPIGIMANRGRGKSYATHALVEEIHDAGVPVVVLDVKGDWWGLRSSADGRSDGLPFYIFGGDHADLPLEPTAGELLADLVVNERVSVVLDLSHMSKTKARSFTVAFAERLYHRNRDPLFVVVDEADVLIPQRATAETARLLGAMEDIAKRGRGRGIGLAVVTQRPQEVAKSVLDLMDTLVLLGMTGPRSLKSISEWISTHVDEDTSAAEVMATLPSLPVGTAWVWSPMQQLLQRVAVRKIRTFDSHVTPKPGEIRRTPQGRASLDLSALGEQIAATVERAKADDPRTLKMRIRDLEQQLATAIADKPEPVEVRIEVPVLAPAIVDQLEALLEPAVALLGETQETLAKHRAWAEQQLDQARMPRPFPGVPKTSLPSRPTATAGPTRTAASTTASARRAPTARASTTPAGQGTTNYGDGTSVPPARLKLLEALLALESIGIDAAPRNQVALFAGVSPKSSGYSNNLGAMNTAGLIRYPTKGRVQITDAGRSHADEVPELATTEALHDRVRGLISDSRWRIMAPLLAAYPEPIARDDLAEAAGVSAISSGYSNNLGALRSLGLLDYPGRGLVIATDVLFLESA